MTNLVDERDPPSNQRKFYPEGKEARLTEAAVMIAFAMHLLDEGAATIELHPDGEHGKRHDIRGSLQARGFELVAPQGRTSYGGVYKRGDQTVAVALTPGEGDVVGMIEGSRVVAECKGGVINGRHPGRVSLLRRGLCEAVGMLIARPLGAERHVAVVPDTKTTARLAERMADRAKAAGIELALVKASGEVAFIPTSLAVLGPRGD